MDNTQDVHAQDAPAIVSGPDVRRVRLRLGLTQEAMGIALGYGGKNPASAICKLETGDRRLRRPQALLLRAYSAGYRPKIWPPVKKLDPKAGKLRRKGKPGPRSPGEHQDRAT